MKKFVCIGTILLALLAASCGIGTKTTNNYLNFEVIDAEQSSVSGFSANELYLATLTESGFNMYTPITESYSTPYPVVSLGDGDSISVTLNNSNQYILATSSQIQSGFYVYLNPKTVYLPNQNSYQINLTYESNAYYGTLTSIPYVYTVNNATISPSCISTNGNITCTVPTTNSVGVLTNATITYILNPGGSTIIPCTGVLAKSIPYTDTVTFASCKISGLQPTIKLQIAYNVPLINVKDETPGGTVNFQGQYYFLSKAVIISQ